MRLGVLGARWGVACGASRAPEEEGMRLSGLGHAGAFGFSSFLVSASSAPAPGAWKACQSPARNQNEPEVLEDQITTWE